MGDVFEGSVAPLSPAACSLCGTDEGTEAGLDGLPEGRKEVEPETQSPGGKPASTAVHSAMLRGPGGRNGVSGEGDCGGGGDTKTDCRPSSSRRLVAQPSCLCCDNGRPALLACPRADSCVDGDTARAPMDPVAPDRAGPWCSLVPGVCSEKKKTVSLQNALDKALEMICFLKPWLFGPHLFHPLPAAWLSRDATRAGREEAAAAPQLRLRGHFLGSNHGSLAPRKTTRSVCCR